MAKTVRNYTQVEETQPKKAFTKNGRHYETAGTVYPTFLKPDDLDGTKEFELTNEDYFSENLTDDGGNVKHFYELTDTETGEVYLIEQFGHLKYLINEIPEQKRKMPLYLLITYKGKQPMKKNPKLSSHLFVVKWANP